MTNGAFFRYFSSKDELGFAAAQHGFAGTTVHEVFASSDAMRAACATRSSGTPSGLAEDSRAALKRHPACMTVTAEGPANYTQTVLQVASCCLKNYLTLLFNKETSQ